MKLKLKLETMKRCAYKTHKDSILIRLKLFKHMQNKTTRKRYQHNVSTNNYREYTENAKGI